MFVRTRPEDGARVVVTQTEAARIANDYRVLSGAREPDFSHIATESEFDAERGKLRTSLIDIERGSREDDLKWAVLNRKAIEYASAGDFGLCRNVHYAMADFLTRRWRLRDALAMYLYVCVLDLNGPNNLSGYAGHVQLVREFPPFKPELAFLAPVPLDQIARIARTLVFGKAELRAIVDEWSPKKLPLSASQAWPYLERALWPNPLSLRKPVHDPASISRAPMTNEIEQTVDLPGGRTVTIWRDQRATIIPEPLTVATTDSYSAPPDPW
jgi:hypothetical protein